MNLSASGATHPGRARVGNEDAYHVGPGFYVVADGMGGAYRGDVASEVAVAAAVATWEAEGLTRINFGVHDAVRRAVEDANAAVLGAGRGTDMGTTIVCLGVDGRRAAVGWVGNSRCGLLRGGEFRWLTRDHSLAEEYRQRDRTAGMEPRRFKALESTLTRVLGRADTVAEVVEVDVQAGDAFLLCSDGVWGEVEDAAEPLGKSAGAILTTVLHGTSPPFVNAWDARQVAESVVSLALEWGGRDNCTAVVVRVEA